MVSATGGGGARDRSQYQTCKSVCTLKLKGDYHKYPVYSPSISSSFFHISTLISPISSYTFYRPSPTPNPFHTSPLLPYIFSSFSYFCPLFPTNHLHSPSSHFSHPLSFLNFLHPSLISSSLFLTTSQHPHGGIGLCSDWVHGCCGSEDTTTNCLGL